MIDQKLTITITKLISITNSSRIFQWLLHLHTRRNHSDRDNQQVHCWYREYQQCTCWLYSNQCDDGRQASGILA